MNRTMPLWALTLSMLVIGCGDSSETAYNADNQFQLAAIDSFDSPRWKGTPNADHDTVLATVEGTPITVNMLKAQLERAPEGTDPEQLLDRMIEFELLAREAFQSGKYVESIVSQAVKKALNQRWLTRTFTEKLSKDDIPTELVEAKFNEAKSYFQHFERFKVLDVQTMCCMEMGDQDNCFRDQFDEVQDRRNHLTDCLSNHETTIRALHQALSTPTAQVNADGFKKTLDTVAAEFPSQALRDQYNTSSVLNEYAFEYDVDTSYEAQFEVVKYRMFFKEIMDGVRKAYLANAKKTPFMTPPIRSPIGWHLLYVYDVIPEQHRTLADAEVNAQVREKLFDVWRSHQMVPQTFDELCQQQGCEPAFCQQLLSHWMCMERVRASKGQTNHESIRQHCDSLLVVDLASNQGNCFYRGHRLVPLQQRQEAH